MIVPAFVDEKTKTGFVTELGVAMAVKTAITGAFVGALIVNDGIERARLVFPCASVTASVQFVYVPVASVLNVTTLFQNVAAVLVLEHDPPYVMVPAFDDEKVTSGVVSVPGVATGVTTESDGALVETVIVNDGNVITLLKFVFASLTATVQSL